MSNIDQILLFEQFYKLSSDYIIYSNNKKISDDVIDIIKLNHEFNLDLLDSKCYSDLNVVAENIQTGHNKTSLFIQNNIEDVLRFLRDKCFFEFIYCDLTSYTDDLKKYENWCALRKLTKFLCIKVVVNNINKFIVYDTSELEISVIFPVYNIAQYLEQCFKNFLLFKHEFVEFLPVNDGSTDNSLTILENMSTKDKRIKILNKTNGGCASARMYGLQHAQGKYVAFVDPDDFVEPDFLLKLHMAAVFSQCQVIQCGFRKYYMETNEYIDVADSHALSRYYIPHYSYLDPIYELYRINDVAIWRRLYKRDFLLKNKIEFPVSIKRFDDLPFFFEVFSRCISFVALPDKLYNYRLNRPGQDVAINDERLYVHFDIYHYLDEFYVKKTGEDKQVLRNLLISRINSHLWALNLLDIKLYDEYIGKMINDFRIHVEHFIFSVATIKEHYGGYKKLQMLLFFGIFFKSKSMIKKAIKRYKETC